MKLTAQQVFDATLVVSQIIRDRRPMSQRGKYLLSRMHSKLHPEFILISNQRDEMITAYGHREIDQNGAVSEQFSVPKEKMSEFSDAWKTVGDQAIDLDIQPIPLSTFDLGSMANGSIESGELLTLGNLVDGGD